MIRNTLILILIVVLSVGYANARTTDPPIDEQSTMIAPVMPPPTASLALTLDLTGIVFNFYFSNDFQNGVGQNNDIYTFASLNSNVRWELAFWANSDFQHTYGNYTIPADQVGVKIALTGNYGNNKIKNNATPQPEALSLSEVLLLEPRNKNKNNAGSNADNSFTIFWQMGTSNGNMNNQSIGGAGYTYGQYVTTVTFVLREAL